MKNLKMFAIGLAAMAAMTMGVNAEPQDSHCSEETINGTCTLSTAQEINSAVAIDKDITIKTDATKTLKVKTDGKLTVEEGKTLTIEGGNLILEDTAEIVIEQNAKLVVKGDGKATGIDALIGAKAKITVNYGTLEVIGNNKGFDNHTKGNDTLTITLTEATFNLKENVSNAMNGGVTINASHSQINVEDNKLGGLNAVVNLTSSDIKATGNGLNGITLVGGSVIDTHSTVTATGNNFNTDVNGEDRTPDKADIILSGDVTVAGKIVADTIAPLKDLWSSDDKLGTVAEPNIKLSNGVVDVNEVKHVCAGKTIGGKCSGQATDKTIKFADNGVVEEGETATVYGKVTKVETGKDITKVVLTSGSSIDELVVAGGTKVDNKTEGTVVAHTTEGDIVEVKSGKTVTAGTATTEPDQPSQNPEQQDPNTGSSDNPSEPPKTGDNIMAFVGLGIASLAVVGLGTKNLKKQTN